MPTQSTEATSTVNFMSQWNQACTAIPSLLSFLNLFNILDATDMLQSNPSAILKNRRHSPHGTEHPPRYSWYLHVHHDIPHGTQDNPTVFKTSLTFIMISPTVLNTPTVLKISHHGTHDIPHGTAHTLYKVITVLARACNFFESNF